MDVRVPSRSRIARLAPGRFGAIEARAFLTAAARRSGAGAGGPALVGRRAGGGVAAGRPPGGGLRLAPGRPLGPRSSSEAATRCAAAGSSGDAAPRGTAGIGAEGGWHVGVDDAAVRAEEVAGDAGAPPPACASAAASGVWPSRVGWSGDPPPSPPPAPPPPPPAPIAPAPPATRCLDDAVFPSHRPVRSEREYGALDRSQYGQFVRFFRQASPYVEGHRGRTFVISLSRPSFAREESLQGALFDVALLHGLGVRVVLVIDGEASPARPLPMDAQGLERAVMAAGLARLEVEGHLSRGLAVSLVRRHAMPGGVGLRSLAAAGDADAGSAGGVWGGWDEDADRADPADQAAPRDDAVIGGARWAGDLAELTEEEEEEGEGDGEEEKEMEHGARQGAQGVDADWIGGLSDARGLASPGGPVSGRGGEDPASSFRAGPRGRGPRGAGEEREAPAPSAAAEAGAGVASGSGSGSVAVRPRSPPSLARRFSPFSPFERWTGRRGGGDANDGETEKGGQGGPALSFPSGRGPWSERAPPQGSSGAAGSSPPPALPPKARRASVRDPPSSPASRRASVRDPPFSLRSRPWHGPAPRVSLPSSPPFSPSVPVVTGNYVVARRRGVVGGVDLGLRGAVRAVQADAIRRQLDSGALVLLTPIGFSAAGEALRCDPLAVAARAAIDLQADKLVLLDDLRALALETRSPGGKLSDWLSLPNAERMVATAVGRKRGKRAERQLCDELGLETSGSDREGEAQETDAKEMEGTAMENKNKGEQDEEKKEMATNVGKSVEKAFPSSSSSSPSPPSSSPPPSSFPSTFALAAPRIPPELERWRECGAPASLLAASLACRAGVRRAHLVDASMEGALLLELYTRGGSGCMVSADVHEGLRRATLADVPGLKALLAPLEARGYLVPRDEPTLEREIGTFRVLQVGSRVMGCAALIDLGVAEGGSRTAELAAFAVHPELRGRGKGDAILDVIEAEARENGIQDLVLLTTRTADWFAARGFLSGGEAAGNPRLPPARRAKVKPGRRSKLFYKSLRDEDNP